ncbi:MAG: c-type cytochrome [Bacteroidota bacterium]
MTNNHNPTNRILYGIIGLVTLLLIYSIPSKNNSETANIESKDSSWIAPSLFVDQELKGEERQLVMYGQDLIAHTARYLGPNGSVQAISNGMNCQNCHLQAGKRLDGNNYSAVFSTYPKFRDRSGSIETIRKRVSDCFERSLNGTAPDSNSREYQAIYAYIKWLGEDVAKGVKPKGSGIPKLTYLNRAADPAKGKLVYQNQCQSCHGANGEGQLNLAGNEYEYPPLWGEHSFNVSAGLFRLSNMAGYVYTNMPHNQAMPGKPRLSVEEAWDVSAYVNSMPRPQKKFAEDWPNISKKPFDHPFGPYTDGFSELQHKYGPFKPIVAAK